MKPILVLALSGAVLAPVFAPALADEPFPAPAPLSTLASASGRAASGSCIDTDTIVAAMSADQAKQGGRTFAIAGDFAQAFDDQWREFAHVQLTKVALVLSHGYLGPDSNSVIVETVEFNADGCAVSRTLLGGVSWLTILRAAHDQQSVERSV